MANKEALLCIINVIYTYLLITTMSPYIGNKLNSSNITNILYRPSNRYLR